MQKYLPWAALGTVALGIGILFYLGLPIKIQVTEGESSDLGGTRIVIPEISMLSATTTLATSTAIRVADTRHVNCSVAAINKAAFSGTVKFVTSLADASPNFYNAVSSTNFFDYAEVVDLQNGASIDGDTGIAMTTEDYRQVEVNTNLANWLVALVTARSSGGVTVMCKTAND